MNTKMIAGIIIALGIGFAIGTITSTRATTNMHRMPDGTMMHDSAHTMEIMMHDMNKALQGKTGDAFDAAFLREMIVHHEGAVDMAEQAFTATERPEILLLANEIIAAQQKEIEQMRAWQQAWFGR